MAIVQTGMVASKAVERSDGGRAPGVHYARALQVLGDRPARYLRSIIEWELGKAQLDDSHAELAHYERARELSRQIGDDIGVAVADIDIGLIKLAFRQPQQALQLARQARAALLQHGAQARVMATYSISIGALTQMHSREVLREIAEARRWELPATSPATRAYLARQMARGYAAVGDHRLAYEEQARSDMLAAQGRKEATNREVLQLQARFEAAQRDAENARLKLRDESARLQLEAERARQQRLWAALAAVGGGVARRSGFRVAHAAPAPAAGRPGLARRTHRCAQPARGDGHRAQPVGALPPAAHAAGGGDGGPGSLQARQRHLGP